MTGQTRLPLEGTDGWMAGPGKHKDWRVVTEPPSAGVVDAALPVSVTPQLPLMSQVEPN